MKFQEMIDFLKSDRKIYRTDNYGMSDYEYRPYLKLDPEYGVVLYYSEYNEKNDCYIDTWDHFKFTISDIDNETYEIQE